MGLSKMSNQTSKIIFLWLSMMSYCGPLAAESASNVLNEQVSPYLRLHAKDPVAWQLWDQQVLEKARKENKLIFVSSGYFSCYWCHVMQRESFSDKKIAALLNENYISVKVDREMDPALDAYLVAFVERTRGSAGWPLNVIISPEGYPIVGMTYLPSDQFASALSKVLQLWKQNTGYIRQMAKQAAEQLHDETKPASTLLTQSLASKYKMMFLQHSLEIADELSGGFGDQSKFPMIAQLQNMLGAYQRKPRSDLKHFLETTLDQMASQGLRDHLGGGFFRYTVDPNWQSPHFEKMLYDNAQLSSLYSRAARILDKKSYLDVVRDTLDFMAQELLAPVGALYSSLSAVDNHNVEGGYYLWQRSELKSLLDDLNYKVATEFWGLNTPSRFEAGYLPVQVKSVEDVSKSLDLPAAKIDKSIARVKNILLKQRQQRMIPIDTKLLAAWNGLALQAFVDGEKITGTGRYKAIAQKIRDYLVIKLWDGAVLHRVVDKYSPQGSLEDYAFAAQGLWQWYLLTGNKNDLHLVKQWVSIAWQQFFDNTGWRLASHSMLPGYFGSPVMQDESLPSPSATLIELSIALDKRWKNPSLHTKIEQALSIGHDAIIGAPFYYATQIEALSQFLADEK